MRTRLFAALAITAAIAGAVPAVATVVTAASGSGVSAPAATNDAGGSRRY